MLDQQGAFSVPVADVQPSDSKGPTQPGSNDPGMSSSPALLQPFSQQLQAPSSACLICPVAADADARSEISHDGQPLRHSTGVIPDDVCCEIGSAGQTFVNLPTMMHGFVDSVFVDCRADRERFHSELVTALAVLQKEGRIPRPSRCCLLSARSRAS